MAEIPGEAPEPAQPSHLRVIPGAPEPSPDDPWTGGDAAEEEPPSTTSSLSVVPRPPEDDVEPSPADDDAERPSREEAPARPAHDWSVAARGAGARGTPWTGAAAAGDTRAPTAPPALRPPLEVAPAHAAPHPGGRDRPRRR
ncbi:hypothetical protein NBM05_14600 [Rothia sp. AR01]|uniref:Uncharacterized protein n=1 Tax=Rothia santali TaxID=2949643 RepID=A0A9X2HCP1_9MICC|nr:hypothetical protein [Rothia santali]MCP3427199.1 hypothetical protein [Rothia santali]